jgi:hypothetical protein
LRAGQAFVATTAIAAGGLCAEAGRQPAERDLHTSKLARLRAQHAR